MKYIYKQVPRPTNMPGVPVILTYTINATFAGSGVTINHCTDYAKVIRPWNQHRLKFCSIDIDS